MSDLRAIVRQRPLLVLAIATHLATRLGQAPACPPGCKHRQVPGPLWLLQAASPCQWPSFCTATVISDQRCALGLPYFAAVRMAGESEPASDWKRLRSSRPFEPGSVYDHQGRSSLSHALRAGSKSVSASGSRDAFMKVSHRLLITVRGHLGVPAFPALGRLLSWTLSASRVCCLEDRRPGILSSCAQQAHSRIPEHPVVVVAFATGQVKEYEHRYMSNKSVPAHATRPLRLVNSDFWRRQ